MITTVTLRTRLPPSLCRDIVARLRDLARVVKLVDTGDLKSPAHCERAGSSPAPGTIKTIRASRANQRSSVRTVVVFMGARAVAQLRWDKQHSKSRTAADMEIKCTC